MFILKALIPLDHEYGRAWTGEIMNNSNVIWHRFFPPLYLLAWLAATLLVSLFWLKTTGLQQTGWALVLVVWALISPYLAIFICCVACVLSVGNGHPLAAEVFSGVARDITRLCVLPEPILKRFCLSPLMSVTSIPTSLYANSLLLNGKVQEAKVLLLETAKSARTYGNTFQKVSALCDLAQMLFYSGELQQARDNLLESAKLLENCPNNVFWVIQAEKIMRGLGDLHNACHDFSVAAKFYNQSIELVIKATKESNNQSMQSTLSTLLVTSTTNLAGVYIWMGNIELAKKCLSTIQDKIPGHLQSLFEQGGCVTLAELKLRENEFEEAKVLIEQAHKSAKSLGELAMLDVHRVRTRLQIMRRDFNAAQSSLHQAGVILDKYFDNCHPLHLDFIELERDFSVKIGDQKTATELAQQFESAKKSAQNKLYGRQN